MKHLSRKHAALLFFMSFLFGVSYIATQTALRDLGPFQVIFSRYFLASLVLAVVGYQKRHLLRLEPEERKMMLLLALIEPVGYLIFEVFGVRYASPSNVALVVATIPVFAVIFAAILLNEKMTPLGGFGILLSIFGVVIVVHLQDSSRLAPRPVLGSIITLGAAILAGLYNSLARRLTRRCHPFAITFYTTIIAGIAFLPMAAVEFGMHGYFRISASTVASLLFLSVGSSVVGYYILNFSLSKIGAAEVAVFNNFNPVFTIIASFLVFGEVMHPGQFVGAALVLAGIFFTFQRKTAAKAELEPVEENEVNLISRNKLR